MEGAEPASGRELAYELFVRFLELRETGVPIDLGEWVEAHPEHAPGLLELHEDWLAARALLGPLLPQPLWPWRDGADTDTSGRAR